MNWVVGKTYWTRGNKIPNSHKLVRIILTDLKARQPIVGILMGLDGMEEEVFTWSAEGKFDFAAEGPRSLDLTTEVVAIKS